MSRKVALDPQESDECKWCDYAEYCSVKTDSPIPVYDQLELGLQDENPKRTREKSGQMDLFRMEI